MRFVIYFLFYSFFILDFRVMGKEKEWVNGGIFLRNLDVDFYLIYLIIYEVSIIVIYIL